MHLGEFFFFLGALFVSMRRALGDAFVRDSFIGVIRGVFMSFVMHSFVTHMC